MILIIGGAYQGKLEYARAEFGLKDEEISIVPKDSEACSAPDADSFPPLDLSRRAVYGLERWVLACVKDGKDPKEYLEQHQDDLTGREDRILIAMDISQGVVPMDPTERAWREENGRTLVWLAGKADRVVRVFCGIPQVIK